MIDELMTQIRLTEQRYKEHEARRKERERHLETLGKGGDWRKVDDPGRILNRLTDLGMDEVISDAMASYALVAEPTAEGVEEVPSVNVLERILDTNDLMNSHFLIKGAAVARSVGRVVIRNAQKRTLGYGTGFMVSPRLLMTNNHVLESRATAENSLIQFNYHETLDGQLSQPIVFELQPSRFFKTDEHLDFTLVAVRYRNEQGQSVRSLGWSRLIPESGKTIVGERVNIIQHPGGERQQLALRQNKITDVIEDFLQYSADTERGSSGSPVFNDQWELAALHHAGVPKRDDSQRILLVSGDPWDGSSQTVGQIAWIANEGARISRIVAHLSERTDFTSLERYFFSQAFTVAPYELVDEPRHQGFEDADGRDGSRQISGPRLDEHGQAVWTVPIEIRVGMAGDQVALVTSDAELGEDGVDVPIADGDLEEPEDSAELQAALARLREFEDRPYYDATQDQADRDEYYQDIDPARKPATLFKHLHGLVRDTHTTQLSYDVARHHFLYPWVDLRVDAGGERELRSVYSDKGFEPEEIIREDFAIAIRRENRLQEMMSRESNLNDEKVQAFLDLLEAQSPFNCEHVVPQSWFNKAQPMKADLHHLFTCEWGCNSFRSNIPYFQFSPLDEATRDDCGQRNTEELQFEPSAGKGPVARATLYFLLRYPGMLGDEAREFQLERLPILLQWHEDEPVTEYERHRNSAIFEAQGNRNPFIDFPEWVANVDFKAGFGIP